MLNMFYAINFIFFVLSFFVGSTMFLGFGYHTSLGLIQLKRKVMSLSLMTMIAQFYLDQSSILSVV